MPAGHPPSRRMPHLSPTDRWRRRAWNAGRGDPCPAPPGCGERVALEVWTRSEGPTAGFEGPGVGPQPPGSVGPGLRPLPRVLPLEWGVLSPPYRATSAQLRGLTLKPTVPAAAADTGPSPRQAHSREVIPPGPSGLSRDGAPASGPFPGACDLNCLRDASPVTCQAQSPPRRRQPGHAAECRRRGPPQPPGEQQPGPSPSLCGAHLPQGTPPPTNSSLRLRGDTQVAETGIVTVPDRQPRDTHGTDPIPGLSQGTPRGRGDRSKPPSGSPGRPRGVPAAAPGGGP